MYKRRATVRTSNGNKILGLVHSQEGTQSSRLRFANEKYVHQVLLWFDMDLYIGIGTWCAYPCPHGLYFTKTRSPTPNSLLFAYFLSKHLLIWFWWEAVFSRAFSLSSSSFNNVSILLCIIRHDLPRDYLDYCKEGRCMLGGNIISFSYTSK